MKKIILVAGTSLFLGLMEAQNVGINATGAAPNTSAGLDVDFTNKGVLIPRIALTARNSNAPIGAGIANSLLVYNTATAGTYPNNVTPGYYYWNGTQWVRLMSGIADGWQINGNTLTGTLPSTPNEFIGTLNAADWIIKTNNTERMRITSGGQVVVNNTTPFAGDVFSSYAAGTNAAINGYSSGSGEAVYGQNTGTGFTILGITTNTNPAVYGQGPNIGTYGQATANNGVGVLGVGPASVTADGVDGIAGNSAAFGVYGGNTNTSGTGIIGVGNNLAGSYLTAGTGGAFTGNPLGIAVFKNGALTDNQGAGYFIASTTANIGVYVAYRFAGTNYKIIDAGAFGGTASTDVWDTDNKTRRIMFAPEAPEIFFQDVGRGQLVNGTAHIDIDPILSRNIVVNEQHPLNVFIQLEGECNGVYVTNKTQTGFDVIELNNGKSNVKFTYFIIANRADYINPETNELISKHEGVRFPVAPEPLPIKTIERKMMKEIKIPQIKSVSIKKER